MFPFFFLSSVSFEDKLKENFARGSAELEKRRQALEDAQRKERDRREREEREAQERREREARELENRRRLEEERRLERMREMERQREEERVRELERKEVSDNSHKHKWMYFNFWGFFEQMKMMYVGVVSRQQGRRWSAREGRSGSEGRKRSCPGGERGSRKRFPDSEPGRKVWSWSWRLWWGSTGHGCVSNPKKGHTKISLPLSQGNKHKQISDRLRDAQSKRWILKAEVDLINQKRDARISEINTLQLQFEAGLMFFFFLFMSTFEASFISCCVCLLQHWQEKLSQLVPEQQRLTEKLRSVSLSQISRK